MENETVQENSENKEVGTDKEQAGNPQGNAINSLELIKEFNEILGSHIERLLDTRFGIEELELDIFSISCIVLLATRETEIETFPASPPARYTESDLIEELAEMSIEPDSEVNKVIENMISKNYLKITDERIFCNKPMSSMAQLFDRIFPQMPGLNLVAYLGQMIDEVLASRKTKEEAAKQFNQMLEIQGVSVNEQAAQQPKKKFSHLRLGDDSPPEKKIRKPKAVPSRPVNIFSQLKTGNVIKTPSSPTVKESIPTPVDEELKDVPDELPKTEEHLETAPVETSDLTETADLPADTEAIKEPDATEETTETKDQREKVTDSFEPADDKEIEDRILEFEEQLGLKCPLCGMGGIKTSETAKGKAYYHCSNSECNFISWGKPYYFECPKCESNFLIETTDSSGRSFLKCPKATCSHWQKFPWDESGEGPEYSGSNTTPAPTVKKPKRKVRRKRRVVRRKKSA